MSATAPRVTLPRLVPSVVVIGLGPAGPELTTIEAREILNDMGTVLLRTGRHPAAEPLIEDGARTLDHHYENAATFNEAYAGIVEEVVAAAFEHGRVAYCVPGSPFVLERSVAALIGDERIAVKVVPGMSFLDLAWSRLLIDPVEERVRLVNAEEFAVAAAGDRGPMLVTHVWSRAICSDVKLAVETAPDQPVVVLHHLGLADEIVREVPWSEIDRTVEPDHLTCLYIRELGDPVASELVRLDELVHVLREQCPWDREQTHESLVRHLLEETYEAIEAIEELGAEPSPEAVAHLEEELGDVLVQVVFHATLAAEEGLFNLADVAHAVHDKLVRRHPHVFAVEQSEAPGSAAPGSAAPGSAAPGSAAPGSAAAVLQRWEQAKQVEKGRESLMDGIPAALPALAYATKIERKAASVDLGWAVTGDDATTLRKALDGVIAGDGSDLGTLLLGLARLGASLGVDPEEELRRSARALRDYFMEVERQVNERQVNERQVDGRGAASADDDGVPSGLAALDAEQKLDAWRRNLTL